ncbi:hypothetical protein [Maribacter spongiicola]|uniref:hypothetical protein n=1 Tax=Maribacter spongiicola TaxID=1206753 RepID=UPI003F99F36A
MKNIRVVAAVAILAVTFISFKGVQKHKTAEKAEMTAFFDDCIIDLEAQLQTSLENDKLNPNDIRLVEIDEEVNLGFDAFEYLPIVFDAYASAELTEQDFKIFESEEEVDLGFDTAAYLPSDFDAYAL